MAKRQSVTDKWDDPWFEKLTPQAKLIWEYLRDNCDHIGIWKVNLSAVRKKCGFSEKVDVEKHLNEMNDVAKDVGEADKIEWMDGKKFLWVVNFIKVQYGSDKPGWSIAELSPASSIHRTVINAVLKYRGGTGLSKRFLKTISTLEDLYPTGRVEVGYLYPNKNKNKKESNQSLTIVGSERANEALQKSLTNPIWLGNVMAANGVNEPDLKKWLNKFTASIANDQVGNFSDQAFQKMFTGWLPNQLHNGKSVPVVESVKNPNYNLKKIS